MSNSKYAVMLGYEPYDYVEKTTEGLLRCMRSIRRDFSSKSYYPERLVFFRLPHRIRWLDAVARR